MAKADKSAWWDVNCAACGAQWGNRWGVVGEPVEHGGETGRARWNLDEHSGNLDERSGNLDERSGKPTARCLAPNTKQPHTPVGVRLLLRVKRGAVKVRPGG